jgi:hypothetical protein
MHKIATATESLSPKHEYVPWVEIEGDSSTKTQDLAGINLKKAVCKHAPDTKLCQHQDKLSSYEEWLEDNLARLEDNLEDNLARLEVV